MIRFEKHTLRNGLRVLLSPMRDTETVTVMIMTGTGSRFENERENGLAHFLEHMFFKGTEKRPDAQAITEELDSVGGAYNAFTAKDRTAYFAKVGAKHIETALDVVSDLFLHSKLNAREINKERGAIIQEINMYEDMPMRTVDEVFEELLFGKNHPLGRTILGPKENILSFKRRDFLNYLRRCYTSENTVVCVAGKFSPTRVLRKIRRDFANMASAGKPQFRRFEEIDQKAPAVRLKRKKTDQTHLMLGVRAWSLTHPDRYVLAVLNTILGGGMSSRLFREIREKRGLAYSVHSYVEHFVDTGYLAAQVGMEHDNLEKVVSLICAEFRKLTKKLVDSKELKKAKEYLNGHLLLGLESSDSVASFLISQEVLKGEIKTPDEIIKAVNAVSAADVQKVARELLRTERLNLALIGPGPKSTMNLKKLLRV